MSKHDSFTKIKRRDFLSLFMSSGVFLGLGCKGLVAMNLPNQESELLQGQQNFKLNSNFTYEQVFNFAFRNWFIRYMKGLQTEIGKERFLEILEFVGDSLYYNSVKPNFDKIQNKDVSSLIENFWEPTQKSKLWGTCITIEILEKAATSGKVKNTNCLVAKTFRENDAADIGYAAICHADFAVAKAFNPKIKMVRNKCLMKGDECCLFEYSMKA